MMCWQRSAGRGKKRIVWLEWHLGKLIRHYDERDAPKLHLRHNYLIQFEDGTHSTMLTQEACSLLTNVHAARYPQWVLLKQRLVLFKLA